MAAFAGMAEATSRRDVRARASSVAVPDSLTLLFTLNPMVGVIDGTRWALFGTDVDPRAIAISLGVSIVLLAIGLRHFRRTEATFLRGSDLMSSPVIRFDGVSKRYLINRNAGAHSDLGAKLLATLARPSALASPPSRVSKRSGPSRTSRSRSPRARSSVSSVATAPASRPRSSSSRASQSRQQAASASAAA